MDSTSDAGPSGSDNPSSDRLSLAALILAAGAFLVAFGQLLMEYVSSSEARNKCTFAAIGSSAKKTKWGWNWSAWKLRVDYPIVNISFEKILDLAQHQVIKKSIRSSPALRALGHPDDRAWTHLDEISFAANRALWAVSDGYTTLVRVNDERTEQTIMTTKDLTWGETASLLWWKLWNDCSPPTRPRASWAQLIMAFGIRDASSLTYKRADADTTPGSVDVPIQRVKLFEIGLLSLCLGFKTVSIRAGEREFEAIGTHGKISTLNIPEIGKVLHFDGDILAIVSEFSIGSATVAHNSTMTAKGQFCFGPGLVANGLLCPLRLILQAVSEGWREGQYDDEERLFIKQWVSDGDSIEGQLPAEASLFGLLQESACPKPPPEKMKESPANGKKARPRSFAEPRHDCERGHLSRPKTALKAWKRLGGHRFGGLTTSPPEDRIACPGLHTAVAEWKEETGIQLPTLIAVASFCTLSCCEVGFPWTLIIEPILPWVEAIATQVHRAAFDAEDMVVSPRLTSVFKTGDMKYARPSNLFWYTLNNVGLNNGDCGWVLSEIEEVYNKLEPRDQDVLIGRKDGEYTGDVHPVLFTDCYTLLCEFNPRQWALRLDKLVLTQFDAFRPANMLWAQVLLLDVAIHFLVRGGFHGPAGGTFYIWAPSVVSVIRAVVESWKGKELSEPQPAADTTIGTPPNTATAESKAVPEVSQHSSNAATGDLGTQKAAMDSSSTTALLQDESPHTENVASKERDAGETSTSRTQQPSPLQKDGAESASMEWNLAESLQRQPELFPNVETNEREAKVKKLARLLQLRAIFVIALLMIVPDSSDVYLAERSEVEMPMV